ncbi:recombinase family protein [Thiocapsa rosea]|uniref:recombinase family protein n=1 Tax=Thiocapsa rosea TaxID=69360 RepID=UPI000EAB48CD|nr:recombinase family protein [Thiocapsa rosea]
MVGDVIGVERLRLGTADPLLDFAESTLQRVERHQESTRLQYALLDRAVKPGWSPSQILLIDEDLCRSGASVEGRPGFQRLMAEVGLDHVGIVLGIEISRLARS